MKSRITLLLTLVLCASAFAQRNVAVLEIERRGATLREISREEAMEITGVIRGAAVRTLPRRQYSVMTSETVQAMGGAVLAECFDETCVIALGRTIDAEYIMRGVLSKFQTMFTLNIEMFETEYGNLVATSEPVRSENLMDILSISGFATIEMLETFLEGGAPQPVVQTAPQPAAQTQMRQGEVRYHRAGSGGATPSAAPLRLATPHSGVQERGLYFDIGMGLGGGGVSVNGTNVDDVPTFNKIMSLELGMIKLGYGPIGNLPIFVTGEYSAAAHMYEYENVSTWYTETELIQFNSYLIGPGILYYPIPHIQLGASIGYAHFASVDLAYGDIESSSGFAWNFQAAVDLGDRYSKGGFLIGFRYFGASGDDMSTSFYGVFLRYVRRHKPLNSHL